MQAFHGNFFKTHLNELLFVYLFFCPFPMKTAEFPFALRIRESYVRDFKIQRRDGKENIA